MRFSLILPAFLTLLSLSPLPITALPAVVSAGLDLLLGHGRSLLITAARTQAAAAFFQGLDETKACLSDQGPNRNDKETADCFVGPLRAISGAYLFSADLNRWFFGAAKKAKDTAAHQTVRFATRAAAFVYLFKSNFGTWARDPATWRNLRCRMRQTSKTMASAVGRLRERTTRAAWNFRKSKTVLWMSESVGRIKRNRNIVSIFGDARSQEHVRRKIDHLVGWAAQRGRLWIGKTAGDSKRRWRLSKRNLF